MLFHSICSFPADIVSTACLTQGEWLDPESHTTITGLRAIYLIVFKNGYVVLMLLGAANQATIFLFSLLCWQRLCKD